MLRFSLSILLVSLATASLVGCSKEEEKDPSSEKTAETGESTDPTETDEDSENVGPQCTAYIACCDEIAAEQPAAAGTCDALRENIDTAVDKGASTASYESGCKQGLATMKQAGYCK